MTLIKSLKADEKTAGQRHPFPKKTGLFGASQQTFFALPVLSGIYSVTLRKAQVF